MTDNGFTITAEYHSLIDALHDEEVQLEALIQEMESFAPSELNLAEGKDPKAIFFNRYYRRINNLSTKIILLSSSVIEACINLYLAMVIDEIGEYELFNDIEKMDLLKKWVVLPRLFNQDYKFDKSGQLYEQLRMLKKKRDAFSHYKISLERGGKKVLKGSDHPHPGSTYTEQANLLMEYTSLPRRLVKHLIDSGRLGPSVYSQLHLLYISLHKPTRK